ncbi:hypothetical protein K7432_006468 [Basidiobolus ranarum]|uniref:Uncharacterized protein n=1 Tax=Basidiobolus ranarum TaxID=34480 RepID=A0ABR2W1M1_9FUNG
MFSIKNLIDSENESHTCTKKLAISTSFSVELNQAEARNNVLERANTMKYLRMLKTRLTYATFKIHHGWENRSFGEVQQLYHETREVDKGNPSINPPTSNHTFTTRETEFVVPRTPLSVGHKRKLSAEVKYNRPLTPRPTFNSSTNIYNNQHSKSPTASNLGCKLNRKALKGSLLNSTPKSNVKDADKENLNPFVNSITGDTFGIHNPLEFTTPPRPLLPRSSTVLDVQYLPSKPDFLPPVGFNKFPESLDNISRRSRSTSPAFEAAETIMMLSSPRPSTPVTPRYSPLENSPPPGPPLGTSIDIHPAQGGYQDGDIFKTPKDPLNLLMTTASYFPK